MNFRFGITLIIAVVAALASYVLATRGVPRRIGAEDADFFCYELRQGWVCMYARGDCESRLAAERQTDVEKPCKPHFSEAPSP